MTGDAQRSEVHQTTDDAGQAPARGPRPGTDPRPGTGLVPADSRNEFRPGPRTDPKELKDAAKGDVDPNADPSDFGGPLKIDDPSAAGAPSDGPSRGAAGAAHSTDERPDTASIPLREPPLRGHSSR